LKGRIFEDFVEIQAESQEMPGQYHETGVLDTISTGGEAPGPACKLPSGKYRPATKAIR